MEKTLAYNKAHNLKLDAELRDKYILLGNIACKYVPQPISTFVLVFLQLMYLLHLASFKTFSLTKV